MRGPSMMSFPCGFFFVTANKLVILVCVQRRGDEHLAAQMQACVLKIRDILVDERDEEEGGMATSYLRLFEVSWCCPGRNIKFLRSSRLVKENTSSIEMTVTGRYE